MMAIDPITPKDWPNVFTSKLIEIYNRAKKAEETALTGYLDFQWNGKVLDVCCEDPAKRVVSIKDIRITGENSAEVDMNYVDPPCYDINYTLYLVFDGDGLLIDEILWKGDPALGSDDILESQEAEGYIEETKQQHI